MGLRGGVESRSFHRNCFHALEMSQSDTGRMNSYPEMRYMYVVSAVIVSNVNASHVSQDTQT
jgi:hypothetical protein